MKPKKTALGLLVKSTITAKSVGITSHLVRVLTDGVDEHCDYGCLVL